MKPAELYKRKPERVDTNIYHMIGCYYNHIPEIDQYRLTGDTKNQDRITINYYKDFCFDGRRTWVLASVMFDDKFVMVTQNAGREGDDHQQRFVTDKVAYLGMIAYLKTMCEEDEDESGLSDDLVDCEDEVGSLTTFYGLNLDSEFTHH